MSLLTEERRIADLLLLAERAIARGCSVAEAAAFIGVPAETLEDWRAQLARAERRHFTRTSRRLREDTHFPEPQPAATATP